MREKKQKDAGEGRTETNDSKREGEGLFWAGTDEGHLLRSGYRDPLSEQDTGGQHTPAA